MRVGHFCNREVVIAQGDESVKDAAELMRRYHVGDLVIVESLEEKRIPIGIVTDRDLVIEVMALGLSPDALAVQDIITTDLITVHEQDDIFDVLDLMKVKGIRRLPVVHVVHDNQELTGIITVDDMTDILTDMLSRMTGAVEKQQRIEARRRP